MKTYQFTRIFGFKKKLVMILKKTNKQLRQTATTKVNLEILSVCERKSYFFVNGNSSQFFVLLLEIMNDTGHTHRWEICKKT